MFAHREWKNSPYLGEIKQLKRKIRGNPGVVQSLLYEEAQSNKPRIGVIQFLLDNNRSQANLLRENEQDKNAVELFCIYQIKNRGNRDKENKEIREIRNFLLKNLFNQ